jgi:hypothetical protein
LTEANWRIEEKVGAPISPAAAREGNISPLSLRNHWLSRLTAPLLKAAKLEMPFKY